MRRVAPLMACALPLYEMMPDAQLNGTVLAQGLLHDSEVTQCIKEATMESNAVFSIPRHLVMRPDAGFIELPVGLGFRASIAPLLEHAAVRAANHAADEKRKKKDEEKAKRRVKERAKLDRGRRRQGLEDEEEEGEGGNGSGLPVQWDELGGGDENSSLLWTGPFPWQAGEDDPLEPTELGRSAPSKPSGAPPKSAGSSRFTPSGPSEQREGSK